MSNNTFNPVPMSACIFPVKHEGKAAYPTNKVLRGTYYRTESSDKEFILLTLINRDDHWDIATKIDGTLTIIGQVGNHKVSAMGNDTFRGSMVDPASGEDINMSLTLLDKAQFEKGDEVPSSSAAQMGILSHNVVSGAATLDEIDALL